MKATFFFQLTQLDFSQFSRSIIENECGEVSQVTAIRCTNDDACGVFHYTLNTTYGGNHRLIDFMAQCSVPGGLCYPFENKLTKFLEPCNPPPPEPCDGPIGYCNIGVWDICQQCCVYSQGGECIEQVCTPPENSPCANGDPGYVWYESTCHCNFEPGGAGGGCETNPNPDCSGSPILIDVAGNNFNLSDAQNGVFFDLNGDGSKEKWSWTSSGSDDVFLVLDRNRNGIIDNGTELFGNFTPQNPTIPVQDRNGFHALAEFDNRNSGGNGDGKISRQDRVFADLRLWQDFNHNGLSEPNEIMTLDELDVRTIDLDFKISRRKDRYGNLFKYRAKVWDERNARVGRWAWDVFLIKGN